MSRMNLLTSESDSFNELHDVVRNSPYYSRLPPLPIECVELDGVPDTLPILIEEIYSASEQKPVVPLLSSSSSSTSSSSSSSSSVKMKTSGGYNENPLLQAVQNFSKNLLKGT